MSRGSFVDDQGHPLSGEQGLVAWTSLVYEVHPGARIAVPVSSTHALETLAAQSKGQIVRAKTSPRALITAALSDKVIFAGNIWNVLASPGRFFDKVPLKEMFFRE